MPGKSNIFKIKTMEVVERNETHFLCQVHISLPALEITENDVYTVSSHNTRTVGLILITF
jgi:hypothetical protein